MGMANNGTASYQTFVCLTKVLHTGWGSQQWAKQAFTNFQRTILKIFGVQNKFLK